jgi:excisionase family DNA binding protein
MSADREQGDTSMSRHRSQADGLLPGRLFAKVPEAAPLLRMDERTVRRACERGEIPGFKVGEQWRIPMSWLRQAAGLGGDGAPAA